MPLGDSLQGMEPATLSLLSLQTRHGPRNTHLMNIHPAAPAYLALLGTMGAGGDTTAKISDFQGFIKAEHTSDQLSINNQHRKELANKGQDLKLQRRK